MFRNRIFSGETLMSIWYGLENGIPSADMSPSEFAPTDQNQLQWPMWGQYYQTKGEAGKAPDMPQAAELLELFEQWRAAQTTDERRAIWGHMLSIYSAQMYSIGLISGILQPVAVRDTLRNVPGRGRLQLGARRPVRDLSTGYVLVREEVGLSRSGAGNRPTASRSAAPTAGSPELLRPARGDARPGRERQGDQDQDPRQDHHGLPAEASQPLDGMTEHDRSPMHRDPGAAPGRPGRDPARCKGSEEALTLG